MNGRLIMGGALTYAAALPVAGAAWALSQQPSDSWERSETLPGRRPPPIVSMPLPPDAVDRERAQSEVELRRIRALARLGLEDYAGARHEAEALLEVQPDDVTALRVLAAVEEANDRWRQAAGYWDQVHGLSGDPAAGRRHDELVAAHPTYVGLAGFFEGSPNVDEQYGVRLTGAVRPLNGPEWEIIAEQRWAQADQVVRLDGTAAPLDVNRQRLHLGVEDRFSFGRAGARITLTSAGMLGGQATIGRSSAMGLIELTAALNEPYWLYAAGIVNRARADYVRARVSHYGKTISGRGSIRASNYGVRDEGTIARSVNITAGLDVQLPRRLASLLFSYILDGEYFSSRDFRTRSDGFRFLPVPFVKREVHSFGAYRQFGDQAQRFLLIGGGYRVDRYGADGPFASGSAETGLNRNYRIGVRAEYSEPSLRGERDEPYAFAEVFVRWLFGRTASRR